MKNRTRNLAAVWVAVWGLGVKPGFAAQNLILAPGSSVSLLGDSTLHPFTSQTTDLQADLAVSSASGSSGNPDLQAAVLQHGALQKLDLTLPVKSLKSKESKLDANMYKALKAETYPTIAFHLTGYQVSPSTFTPGASLIKVSGALTISGQQKPVVLEANAEPQAGTLHIQGDYVLLMSDYGIKPPSLMLGTIKVKDRVVIHYDLHLELAAETLHSKDISLRP